MTRGEFLRDPVYLWNSGRRAEIAPEWFAEAWRTVTRFRAELTYGLGRYASKLGEFLDQELLALLGAVLTTEEVLELHRAIYACAGNRESEWRTEFERAFSKHAAALPPAADDDSGERWGERFEGPA